MSSPSFSTTPVMVSHWNRLKSRFHHRDQTHGLIHGVMNGHLRSLFPDELDFSLSFQGTPISNFIEVVARDVGEGLAPLPALSCVSGKMKTDADLERAEKKNRIGEFYWRKSGLASQMMSRAISYTTYGFIPAYIEADPDEKLPYIHVEDPRGAYYETDRFGRCKIYARAAKLTADELAIKYPEYAHIIRTDPTTDREVDGDTRLELVRWVDDKFVTVFMPERQGLIVGQYAHRMSRCPVAIAERPSEGDIPRGQFDDAVWTQVARAIMSLLALEGAAKSVQAPIAIPEGIDELPMGPDAVLQGPDADKIHRVALDIPQGAFAESQLLDQELRVGTRYPDARSGVPEASVITGKGVQALLGGFDSQIKSGQQILKPWLEELTSMCFEMDEVWWPDEFRTVAGTTAGTSYEFDYQPSKDINGRWGCTVTYGFAAGMDPSQSVITMLQLEGAGLVAKGTTQENLPFSIDPIQEQRRIDIEGTREALKQGLFAYVQSAGQLAASGQGDPTQVIQLGLSFVKGVEQGQSVEDSLETAFQQLQAAQEQARQQQMEQIQQQMQAAQGAGGGPPGMGGGAGPDMQAAAQGLAGKPEGGMPTISNLVAGFRGNGSLPIMQATIQRRQATGT